MNEGDKQSYRHRYVKRLDEFGYDPKTLGWTAGKQAERFEVLTSIYPIQHVKSVLDVGCGFGDLYCFLKTRGFCGRYQGIDIVSELISTGRSVYPEADLRTNDLFDVSTDDKCDIVVASGIFNAKLLHENQWQYITDSLSRMFELCRVGVAADFLTSYVDFHRDDLYYTAPEAVFRLAKSLSRRVTLLHNYMPFEFSIHIYKNDQVAEGARFFPAMTSDHYNE